jgi:hypothetical protein
MNARMRKFELGEKVRVIVSEQPHGMGYIKKGDIGVVKEYLKTIPESKYNSKCPECEDGMPMLIVEFPNQDHWMGHFSMFETCLSHPPIDNPLKYLRGILPDVYGKEEHSIYMDQQEMISYIEESYIESSIHGLIDDILGRDPLERLDYPSQEEKEV